MVRQLRILVVLFSRCIVRVRPITLYRRGRGCDELVVMSESNGIATVRRSRAEAERLVVEFERSGLPRKAFCRERGISAHTLDYYRRQWHTRQQADHGRMVAVELLDGGVAGSGVGVDGGHALCVRLTNGRRIEVSEDFDAATLQRLIAALEAG